MTEAENLRGFDSLGVPSEDEVRRKQVRRRRFGMMLVAALLVAIISSIAVTLVAYPGLLYSFDAREQFFRDNYGGFLTLIAGMIAISAAAYLFADRRSGDVPDVDELIDRTISGTTSSAKQDGVPSEATEIDIYRSFKARMLADENRLRVSANLNLIAGLVFAVVALGILSIPIFQPVQQGDDLIAFLRSYIPKATLGLMLQIISFFFLRLYGSNQQDLKHNKNEITNIDAKLIALKSAKSGGNRAGIQSVVNSLARTERNFVLKKGERTTVSEIDIEYNDLKDLLVQLGKVLPRIEKTS